MIGRAVTLVGTDPRGRGGVATVIRNYLAAAPRSVRVLVTHRGTGTLAKLTAFPVAVAGALALLATGRGGGFHIHMSSRWSCRRKMVIGFLCRLFRRPYLIHLHGGEFQSYALREAGPLERRAIDRMFEGSAGVIVLSRMWDEFVRATWPACRTFVLHNAVPMPAGASRTARDVAPMRCVFLGRMEHNKGIDQLVPAIRDIARARPEVRFDLAGDGDVEGTRAALAPEGDRVTVHGWLDRAGSEALIRSGHVFILPSRHEGLPMALLEAMAHGLAPVVTPVGGIPDVVEDGVNGLSVAPGSAADITRAVLRLAGDGELRARLGTAAARTVEQGFSLDVHLRRLNDIYDRVFGAVQR